MGIKLFAHLGLLLKGAHALNEAEKAHKEGTLQKSLQGLLHILAMAAPLAGGVLFEEIAKAAGRSDDHLIAGIGTFLFALIPLIRRFGNQADRGVQPIPGA